MLNIVKKLLLITIVINLISFSNTVYASESVPLEKRTNPNVVISETPQLENNTLNKEEIVDISDKTLNDITYKDFLTLVNKNEINYLYFDKLQTKMYASDIKDNYYIIDNPDYETFRKDMLEKGVIIKNRNLIKTKEDIATEKTNYLTEWILVGSIFFIIWFCVKISKSKNKEKITILNKKKLLVGSVKGNSTVDIKDKDPSAKTFDDVAGLKEVKKDMTCLVDFLKNAEKYKAAGAKLPKGVILYGPPGTGKTLIAKAVAGEAGVPFMYMSGSDFIELYVGVGAKRVRELFEKAKKSAPCIVFIDEIDAIGGKRTGNDSSGEDRKTINALLTEMDGFHVSDNILVIGATNRIDDLDPALVRPGRFTNKYCVPLPSTSSERLEIIKLYSKNKKIAESVDFNGLAKETIGFSPAQIESLMNEAAIISVQDNKALIDRDSLEKAMFKILLSGHIKDNQKDRDKDELKLVAWHEAGHALVGKLQGKEVNKVTILSSTSGAGGVTFTTPSKMGLQSVNDLKNEIKELYGGRIAEQLLFKDKEKVTTGASNDIERATNIIKEIISTYGMTDSFGLLNLNQLKLDENKIIEEEIKLAKALEKETYELLLKNIDKLELIANNLLEKETLYEKDLDEIIFQTKKEK